MDEILKIRAKKEPNLLNKALIIVEELFKDKYDKEGIPYINHLYYVRDNVDTLDEKTVGLLHDIIEDTSTNCEDLLEVGFPLNIVNSIKILTRDKKISYPIYINSIINSNDMVAIRVKRIDMTHNMKRERLDRLKEQERNRLINKYSKEFDKIENYLEERKI